MSFVLNPTRKITVKYEDPETKESFEADFKFILTEECFTEDFRKKTSELETILESDPEEVKQEKMFKSQAVIWYRIRKSLVEVRGIKDPEGNSLEVNEETQAAIFEFIVNFGDIAKQLLAAYMGLSLKNLKAGAMKS